MSKTIVITGTSSGFGHAAVQRFANEGWNVVATVRQERDLAIHADLSGVKTLLFDVDHEADAEQFAADAISQFGAVDALVNNAGYYQMGPVETSSMDQVHRQLQTNVFGLIALTKAFIPGFRVQRSGAIVNISSISADQGYPYAAVYAASKAAVAAFTEGLNVELADFGVTAKAVFPGLHATKIFTKVDHAETPEEYQAGLMRFVGGQGNGSLPEVTVDGIFRAVVDPDLAKVRYYTGPDGQAIPRAKQLLGQDWYWEEFRSAARGNPSALWTSLRRQGDAPVEYEL